MKVRKVVITAASRQQRNLPLQSIVDSDGQTKSVLNIIVGEARQAGIDEIGVVISPGDEENYRRAAGDDANLHFIPQTQPLGYGHALFCAYDFVDNQPFLHLVGDHIYVSRETRGCAQQVVEAAEQKSCAVSGVQPTRESQLTLFGAVGGQRITGQPDLFDINCVMEKPTPTVAEQSLIVPGLRQGHYLCFFGIHVLTPIVMQLLQQKVNEYEAQDGEGQSSIQLSPVLHELAQREKYLALETQGHRYPVDVRYGLLSAQLALGLNGREREEVLALLCEVLAQRASTSLPII